VFEADGWERSWRDRLPDSLPETVVEGSFGVLASLEARDPNVLALLLELLTDLHRGSTRTRLGPSRWLPELDPRRGKTALVEAGLIVDLGDDVAGVAVHRREQTIRRLLQARTASPLAEGRARMEAAVAAMTDLGPDQKTALERAASARTLAVVGGPGTGKTWLTARLVRAWLEAGIPPRRVACLAPTGKAAQRLGEALAELPVPPPQTLHRMLGWASDPSGPERVPPPVDAVLIDEGSMVELAMMERLLATLSPERLVWVGDPEQLPSVAAGAPFRDFVVQHPEHVARLEVGRRQSDPLAAFARSVAEGDATASWSVALPSPEAEGVFFVPPDPRLLEAWARDRLASSGHQVLTVVREGPWGAEAANRRLGSWRRAAQPGRDVPEGQPLMVIRNDYGRRLFNGDVGRVEGGLLVFERSGASRRFPIGSLQTAPADAMTVHKAQGSEFEAVLFLLPERPHPLVDRALIYTAVTRARRQVVVATSEEAWRAGLGARRTRSTTT